MRLEISGKEVNITDQLIAISRAAINVDNITERKIDITNRFDLPDTNNNREILNSGQSLGSSSDGFDKLYPAKIIDQDFLFIGLAFVREYTNRVFKIQLTEGSKSFFDALNNKLTSLDLEDYDITFNQAAYDATKFLGQNTIWAWPVISMHQDNLVSKSRYTSGNDGLKYSRPSIRYDKLLDEIFESKGWTYSFEEDILQKLCISVNHEEFNVTSYQKTLTQSITGNGDVDELDTNDFEKDVTTTDTTIDIGNLSTKFRIRGTITTTSAYQIQIQGSDGVDTVIQTLNLEEGVNNIDYSSKIFSSDTGTNDISINVVGSGNIIFNDTLLYTIIEENAFGDLSTNPLLDYKVKVYDNLPDFKQIEIFRNLLLMTNSILEPSTLDKNINIRSLKKLNKNKSLDWSNKFETGSENIINRPSNLAQENELIYDNDDTVFESLGSSSFSVNISTIQDSLEFIKLDFGATNEVDLNSFDTAEFSIYDDTERVQDINPRIIYMYNDNDVSANYTIGRFTDLDWRMLKEEYYKNWFESLSRYRLVEGFADLRKLDVVGHDFMDLVYLDQFKSSFFVLEIEDYIPGRLTEVKLLKFL